MSRVQRTALLGGNNIWKLRYETKLEANGEPYAVEGHFEVIDTGDGSKTPVSVRTAWKDGEGGWHTSTLSYHVASWDAYVATWTADAKRSVQQQEFWAQSAIVSAAQLKKFNESPLPASIERAFDTEGEWILRLIRAGIENHGDENEQFEHFMAEFASIPYGTKREAVETRKIIRPALSSAKEQIRDEYPDDYKDEEDKDDFYENYFDDVAERFMQEF